MAEKEEAGEEEYESDLDEAALQTVRRRAAASDDDDDEDDGGAGTGLSPPLRVVGPDSDSDGQGAAEAYDSEEEFYDEEESEECEVVCEEFVAGGGETNEVADEVVAAPENESKPEEEVVEVKATVEREDVKQGSGPCAVPTAGAFYMHDDRFHDEDNGSHGRQRAFFGGQKLWYPKDEVWVHDRFDGMNLHGVRHDHATRRPIETLGTWGGGRTNGVDHGSFNGTKSRPYFRHDNKNYKYIPKGSDTHHNSAEKYNGFSKEPNTSYDNPKYYRRVPTKFHSYYDDTKNFDSVRRESHTYHSNAKHYNNSPNVYRGRASRPHQPDWKNSFDISSAQSNSSLEPQSRPILRVKTSFPSGGHGNAVRFLCSVSTEGTSKPATHSSVSTSNNYSQYPKSRNQGTGNIGDPTKNKLSSSTRQATRSYAQSHSAVHQQISGQQHVQLTPKTSTPTFHQEYGCTNKIQFHPQTTSENSIEDAETSTPCGSNNSIDSSAEGQNDKEAESVSFPYYGDHVLGLTGEGHTLGGQSFTDTPALLPVIHFNGQHPRGPDISSIGMAQQRFVAPQQLSGNCEMSQTTWLPVLTGATGALGLGATYSTPNFGSYYPQSSEFLSSSVSPRDQIVSKVPISINLDEIPEIAGHEHVQRKNKPRRYSEMNFAS